MTPVGAAMRGQEFYYAQFYLGQFRFERSLSKHLVCRGSLDGIGASREPGLDLGGNIGRAYRNLRRSDRRQLLASHREQRMDQFSGDARQRCADVSGGRRNRSAFVKDKSAGERA